jgi:hypothetical protein
MEGERCRCQVLHRQARELVCKVFSYFKREADTICVSVCVCVCMYVRTCVCIYVSVSPVFVRVRQYRTCAAHKRNLKQVLYFFALPSLRAESVCGVRVPFV